MQKCNFIKLLIFCYIKLNKYYFIILTHIDFYKNIKYSFCFIIYEYYKYYIM